MMYHLSIGALISREVVLLGDLSEFFGNISFLEISFAVRLYSSVSIDFLFQTPGIY